MARNDSNSGAVEGQLEIDKETLIATLEQLDGSAGNKALRSKLDWSEDRYAQTRDALVDNGIVKKGKGKGGSVSIIKTQLKNDKEAFLQALGKLKGSSGNKALRERLGWESKRYFAAQNALVNEGTVQKGRGHGGSVSHVEMLSAPTPKKEKRAERKLYGPAKEQIERGWTQDRDYKNYVVVITGHKGSAKTGGTWSRPDITVVATKTFSYFPTKLFDVVTFELKTSSDITVHGVYEALSHQKFATMSYVLFQVKEEDFVKSGEAVRIVTACKEHGIGLILAENINDFDTWAERLDAARTIADPSAIDGFIKSSFPSDAKNKILEEL